MTLTLTFQDSQCQINGAVGCRNSYSYLTNNCGLSRLFMRYDFKIWVILTLTFTQSQCDGAFGRPIYYSYWCFDSNIWLNSFHLRGARLQNLSDLDFDLSRSHKVKSDGAVGPSIYACPLVPIVMTLFLTVNWKKFPISYHWPNF